MRQDRRALDSVRVMFWACLQVRSVQHTYMRLHCQGPQQVQAELIQSKVLPELDAVALSAAGSLQGSLHTKADTETGTPEVGMIAATGSMGAYMMHRLATCCFVGIGLRTHTGFVHPTRCCACVACTSRLATLPTCP